MQFDLVLSGGRVVDGTGTAAFKADVGLVGNRIAAIGDLAAAPAGERLDVAGRVVTPGFIDMHTHSDISILACPTGDSKIHQGVTTEVVGNCGLSMAPTGDRLAGVRRTMAILGGFVDALPWDWRSYGDFLDRVEAVRPSLNIAALVGHVTVRIAAGADEQRAPTPAELATMKAMVREAMEAGCFGVSSGLVYPPGSYADTDELVDVAAVAAEFGGLYFTHMRDEGKSLMRGVAEAIEVGERAHLGVQLAHHKAAFRPYWGRLRQAIQLSEWANERGQDVTWDVYPYTAGSAGLTQIIPDWAHAGGLEALLDRLRQPDTRARLTQEVKAQGREWDKTIVSWLPEGKVKQYEGQTIAQVAADRNSSPEEALFTLLLGSAAQAMMVHFVMAEDDVRYSMKHPLSTFGSDGWVLTPKGILAEGKPHPRSYGTYPRIMGHYVRQEGLMSLEEAVHKAAYRPARKMGLVNKGRVQAGADADLVVFDPATIIDEATYTDPHRYPTGIDHVIVAGQVTIRNGEHTGARAGQVLRKR